MFEKILSILGITNDVISNVSETKSDVKDNKPKKRKYDFDDKNAFSQKDFDGIKKNAQKQVQQPKTKTKTDDDREI